MWGALSFTKTCTGRISWPDTYSESKLASGLGSCSTGNVCCDSTPRTTECWPGFAQPTTNPSGTWQQIISNKASVLTITSCPGGCSSAQIGSCMTISTTLIQTSHFCSIAGGGGGGGECYGGDNCGLGKTKPVNFSRSRMAAHAGKPLPEIPSCCQVSPILIDILGDGFALTDAAGGVDFDFNFDGRKGRVSWTVSATDDAWLVFDRNGNGTIDSGGRVIRQCDATALVRSSQRLHRSR